jgi:glucokinase
MIRMRRLRKKLSFQIRLYYCHTRLRFFFEVHQCDGMQQSAALQAGSNFMNDCVVGVDIGGTMIKGGLFDRRGTLLKRDERVTLADGGEEALVDAIVGLASSLQGAPGRAAALGIGIAGLIDSERAMLLTSPNLPLLNRVPLKAILEQQLEIPVCLENDANVAALGELWVGQGRGCESFMLVTIGTGIGSGLILNGALWTGETGKAAEFGHVCVVPDGRTCGCGKKGCIEAYGSGTAMVQMAREALACGELVRLEPDYRRHPERLTPKVIYAEALKGDTACLEIFRTAARCLGIALAGVNNLLDIHTFILGGGVSKAAPVFEATIVETVRENVFEKSRDLIRIIISKLGNDAGIYGAGCLALQHLRRR